MDKELLLFQDESEDVILARIQEESLRYYNEVELPRRVAIDIQPVQREYKPEFSTEPHCSKLPDSSHQTPVKDVFYKMSDDGAEGFHLAAGDTFVYPTNYPIRKYQKNIILSALFHNTLVSLPTGLGKTFIAAVVMFNYYRWFPEGKIVFMAPTRPLVAQQIRACHDIMAIPVEDTIEMTGSMNPTDRSKHWKSKRVFFLTPQVMANDIRSGVCPTKFFKCVVIDEAHKATKEYAYCHVIKGLEEAGAVFRVLALSATPGSNIKAVIEVVQNLRISTLELRGEDSPDVIPYIHTKQIEPISLSLSKNIIDIREPFLKIYDKYLKNLRDSRFVTCNVQNLTKFQLLKLSEKMRSQRPPGMTKERIGVLMSDFTVCMTLAHGLDLLQTYGLRAFYQYFTAFEDEDNRKAAFTRLRQDVGFLQLVDSLHTYVSSPMDQFWSHPKHEQLVKILIEHYSESENTENCQTKVIIFCQYRVVVSEIYELLNKIHPLIKPVMFIGQGVGKDKTGLPQKKQMEIMKNFREGKSNVLIATCVAEEGLDIGSVDLLILMEVQRSPVRLVQRLGRTGRHRKGRCVVLLTQGREVQKFDEAMATRKTFLNNIQKSKLLIANLYKDDPRMIPPEFVPKMLLVHINVPERITPGKNIKQSTIRQTLLNSHLSDNVEEEESPFLSKEQLDCNKDELGTYQITFTSLPLTCSEYMYPKINDRTISMEELFRPSFCHLSEYNDWNRGSQPTYLLSHSSDSEMLCHLLKNAEFMHLRDNTDEDVQVCVNSKSMNLNKPTKNKTKNNKELGKKKNLEIEEKPNMDIRQCMAVGSNKVCNTQIKYYQQPVVLDETSVIESDDQVQPSSNNVYKKENIIINNKQAAKHRCLFFKQTDGDMLSTLKNIAELADNKDISLTLSNISQINKLLKSFTKEIINNINVSTLFTIDSKFLSNKSVLQKDKPSSYKINKLCSEKHNSLSTEVNKMYSLLETSPTKITNTLENIDIPKEQNESNSEEYFNFDDIFSGDDKLCDFGKEKHRHKTSTPKEKITDNYQLFNTLDSTKSRVNILQCSILSNKEKCPSNNLLSKSSFISSKSKFNFQSADLSVVSNIVLNDTDLLSPESPVLSGQILHSVTSKTQSKGRRSLFKNNDLDYDIDLPLSRKQSFYSSDIGMKKPSGVLEEVPNLSSTKLFHGEDLLDQSSMYTVTQLVETVTSSKDNLKQQKDIHELGSLNGTKETNLLFTNTRDDVQFQDIDIPSIKDKITNHEVNMVPNLMVTNQIKMSFPNPDNNSVVDFNNMFTIEHNNFEPNHPLSERKKVPDINQSANYRNQSINNEIAQTSPLHSDSEELFNVQSESDASSDVFIHQKYNKKLKPTAKHEKVNKNRFLQKTKKNQFIEMEADVSGNAYSTDEEITSDLDDLEESFINDLTELPNSSVEPASDTQARYLQSVKYRLENPGGFKIPKLTNSVLAMDVYSQLVEEEDENDTYVNDSFCCDATEIPTIQEPSLLDIAEEILKSKKSKKRRIIHLSSDSSADDDNSSIKNKKCKTDKSISTVKSIAHLSTVKHNSLIKKTRVIHSDSDNDSDNTKNTHKNQFPINQSWNQLESSPDCSRLLYVNIKSKKGNHLLTSSDSDATL